MADPPDTPVFEEHQRFRQPWLWAVLLMACLLAANAALGAVLGRRGTPWVVLPALLPVLLAILLYSLDMHVRVDGQAVSVRYSPLWGTRISLADIASCEARSYRPILEYGGWGVRYCPFGGGWAYNVSGNRGVQLVLANGRRVLIGSQRPEELAGAINAAGRGGVGRRDLGMRGTA